jgi:hypothetical protein
LLSLKVTERLERLGIVEAVLLSKGFRDQWHALRSRPICSLPWAMAGDQANRITSAVAHTTGVT